MAKFASRLKIKARGYRTRESRTRNCQAGKESESEACGNEFVSSAAHSKSLLRRTGREQSSLRAFRSLRAQLPRQADCVPEPPPQRAPCDIYLPPRFVHLLNVSLEFLKESDMHVRRKGCLGK